MKQYQISESDLETLEAAFPELASALGAEAANRRDIQEHMAMVKKALSDVRWNYGPHENIEEVDS